MREMKVVKAQAVALLVISVFSSLVFGKSTSSFTRDDFPSDFIFGAGTSTYQYEGATKEDGRSQSIWDTYSNEGRIAHGDRGDVAADGYHKYKEDVRLMSETGLEGYRFSFSWSRILPSGRGAVNPKGIQYYNNVIDELVKHGIEPHVTLVHYDFPQVLQDEYGGWLSPKIIDDFRYFAEVCFKEFGDRVPYWTSFNEMNVVSMYAYDYGLVPPNRCSNGSNPQGHLCKEGNSRVEPYVAAHNMILAHSAAAEVYRKKYQATQKGKFGINIWTFWAIPLTNSMEDKLAAQRSLDFIIGWFLHPLVFGDYPAIMKQNAGSRLPSFTEAESRIVKGAIDFVAINYYFSLYVADAIEDFNNDQRDMSEDMLVKFADYSGWTPHKWLTPPETMPTEPDGLPKLLEYLANTYGNPIIYIEENGFGIGGEDRFNDTDRISYLSAFIGSTLKAIRDGSNVKGYFVWSFVDQLEFAAGYTLRVGLYHVNYTKQCERTPKQSAFWYSNFLKNNGVIVVEEDTVHLRRPVTQPILEI